MKPVLLASAVALPSVVYGANCDFEPIALPITDVQVLPDVEGSLMRGIPATIGSSNQSIVMLPWA